MSSLKNIIVALLATSMLHWSADPVAGNTRKIGSTSFIGFRVEEIQWETGGNFTVFRAKVAHVKQRDDWTASIIQSDSEELAIRVSPQPAYSSKTRVVAVTPSLKEEPDSDFDLARCTLLRSRVLDEKRIRTSIYTDDGRIGGGGITAVPGMTQYVGIFAPKEPNDPLLLTLGFPESGSGYRLEIGLNVLPPFPPFGFPSGMLGLHGIGSEIQIVGDVNFATLSIHGDPNYPLSFKMIRDKGFVRLFGHGMLKDKNGKIWKVGERDTVDVFIDRLKSSNPIDRERAAGALGWLSKDEDQRRLVIPRLTAALNDNVPEVRRNAAEALGRLQAVSAVNDIQKMLEDPDEWVRSVAKEVSRQLSERK